jgi:hypothetical protein
MYPEGFHPSSHFQWFSRDLKKFAPVIPRSRAGVKYYFVNYDLSSYFPAGSPRRVNPADVENRHRQASLNAPELSNAEPHDPFKVDIFTIGNVLREVQMVRTHLKRNLLLTHVSDCKEYHQLQIFRTPN